MRKYSILILVSILLFTKVQLNAQVTIGTHMEPEKAALLDLKTKDGGDDGGISTETGGLLLPRISLENINGLTPFIDSTTMSQEEYNKHKKRHTGLAVYNITRDFDKNIEKGVYIWSGNRWEKGSFRKRVNFFYMPSIVIDTTNPGAQAPIDLYTMYKNQFENPAVKSNGSPDQIPFFVKPEDLFYYITDYDTSVLNITSISNKGLMEYEVLSNSSEDSFINIVFVVNVVN